MRYLNKTTKHAGFAYEIKQGFGIGYVVPQVLNIDDASEKVSLKFRVAKPFKDIVISIKEGERLIKKIIKPAIVPSEMEIVYLPKELFQKEDHTITVSVEEKK